MAERKLAHAVKRARSLVRGLKQERGRLFCRLEAAEKALSDAKEAYRTYPHDLYWSKPSKRRLPDVVLRLIFTFYVRNAADVAGVADVCASPLSVYCPVEIISQFHVNNLKWALQQTDAWDLLSACLYYNSKERRGYETVPKWRGKVLTARSMRGVLKPWPKTRLRVKAVVVTLFAEEGLIVVRCPAARTVFQRCVVRMGGEHCFWLNELRHPAEMLADGSGFCVPYVGVEGQTYMINKSSGRLVVVGDA